MALQKRWLLFAIIAIAVTATLTHIPPEKLDVPTVLQIHNLDKAVHFSLYCAIGFSVAMSVRPEKFYGWLVVFLIIAILAAIDESTQVFVRRTVSFADYCADTIGITTGIVIAKFFFLSNKSKNGEY